MFNPNQYEPKAGGSSRNYIQPGKHRVHIAEVSWDEGRATLAVTYRNDDGATIRAWYPVEGPRAWTLANLCRAVGWPHAFDPRDPRSTAGAFVSQELEIVAVEDTYNGKTRTQVKYTNRLASTHDRPAPAPLPPVKLASDADDDIPF